MKSLSEKQKIQERKYDFPYHYIPKSTGSNFAQVISVRWGYEYLSYIYFVLRLVSSISFNSLMDVGCGDGKFLFEASQLLPGKKLFGLDISERSLAYAKVLNPDVNFLYGDITDTLLCNEKFDIITTIETLEHIPDNAIDNFIQGLYYYLKNNGTLILTVPSNNMEIIDKHYQHFDMALLRGKLDPYFAISEYFFLNRNSVWIRPLESLLENRLFILNNQYILNLVFKVYEKYFLIAKERDARRLCVFCKRR